MAKYINHNALTFSQFKCVYNHGSIRLNNDHPHGLHLELCHPLLIPLELYINSHVIDLRRLCHLMRSSSPFWVTRDGNVHISIVIIITYLFRPYSLHQGIQLACVNGCESLDSPDGKLEMCYTSTCTICRIKDTHIAMSSHDISNTHIHILHMWSNMACWGSDKCDCILKRIAKTWKNVCV